MMLKEQEEQWTHELKSYIDEELIMEKKPTLMEIAQIAISSEGDLADAVARVEGIQRFKEAYNIQDTLEQGVDCLEKFSILHEGVFLNVEGGSGGFRSSFAWNYGTYHPSRLIECEEKWRIHIMGCYYLYYKALQPTLESVRTGVTLLAETSDMKWKTLTFPWTRGWSKSWVPMFASSFQKFLFTTPILLPTLHGACLRSYFRKGKHTRCI
jgi:hypothetical protein